MTTSSLTKEELQAMVDKFVLIIEEKFYGYFSSLEAAKMAVNNVADDDTDVQIYHLNNRNMLVYDTRKEEDKMSEETKDGVKTIKYDGILGNKPVIEETKELSQIELYKLCYKQCERQIEHAKVNLNHSGNEIGRAINLWTLDLWRKTKEDVGTAIRQLKPEFEALKKELTDEI